jgi:GDP/UDP-N,N'-diacetylbacillosamine 2-epimerase (hydrolysing)
MMLSKKKILIVTERRADFSRFKPIISLINKDNSFKCYLVVTGSHLIKKHGSSISDIKKSYFKIYQTFQMFDKKYLKKDTGTGMTRAIGKAFIKLSKIVDDLKPDIILSGFDIGANFALTVIGAHANIPVFHIQGGEVSGTIDESLRHAMSKFSHYHFVANHDAKKRLIRMGEDKWRIFNVGCPSIDALIKEKILTNNYIKKKFNIDIDKNFLLIIQHPVTTEYSETKAQIIKIIKAMKKIKIQKLMILPNNDAGASKIISEIKRSGINYCETLKINEYKTLLSKCSVLVGNSSSGIHEAATFKKPVVNIGSRQNGRLKPANVLNSNFNTSSIYSKIIYCLKNKKFRRKITKITNPYGKGNTSKKILSILKKINFSNKSIIQKKITY